MPNVRFAEYRNGWKMNPVRKPTTTLCSCKVRKPTCI